jgi:cytochrome c1
MSADNLSLFVADAQRFKPANRMPPFSVLNNAQLADVAAYLMALK